MAERIRNSDWENDEEMRHDLEKYVQRNLKRKEILDFMSADYPMYAWSIRTLSRRLQHFNIKYTNYDIALEDVKTAVKKELNGPGVLLGYRAIQQSENTIKILKSVLSFCPVLPQTLRLDRGTETDVMATIHCFLRGDLHNALDAIIYGPSTQNKIERWWRDLLERMERFFKEQLKCLVESGDYDSSDQNDRDLLAYVYIPIIQKELDIFRECVWNNHRTRKQRGKELPAGIPEHIFHFPEKYGGEQCGIDITEEQLLEVSELSNVLEDNDDYLRPAVREERKKHLPQIHEINPNDAKEAYLYLKSHVDVNIF
ncbi:uncharacterized protein LOC124448125 [Xenia sp. Carnegie-2017]|uniref:uncharacterized protein LOC124448125 n=1 Tax=Xenia sp. Carnegie-2017 TaxID=2897299 RepID=UPI001F0467EB|nr:uncharacterized protein LOC124448125 [Xenia sp. Carnegie-2017]